MPVQPDADPRRSDSDRIVLASTSRYRRALLERLALPFAVCSPEVDETPLAGENAEVLVLRLAEAKARAVTSAYPASLIVGSDQVAEFDGGILGKPGSAERARAQLAAVSGKSVTFHTGLCLLNAATDAVSLEDIRYAIRFRMLEADEIARYVAAENPIDSAGSIKSEGLAVTLFESMQGPDPSALVGLPLIALSRMLREHGVVLP